MATKYEVGVSVPPTWERGPFRHISWQTPVEEEPEYINPLFTNLTSWLQNRDVPPAQAEAIVKSTKDFFWPSVRMVFEFQKDPYPAIGLAGKDASGNKPILYFHFIWPYGVAERWRNDPDYVKNRLESLEVMLDRGIRRQLPPNFSAVIKLHEPNARPFKADDHEWIESISTEEGSDLIGIFDSLSIELMHERNDLILAAAMKIQKAARRSPNIEREVRGLFFGLGEKSSEEQRALLRKARELVSSINP